MSLLSYFRSQPHSALVDAFVVAGIAGVALYRLNRTMTSRRRSQAATETIQAWEGEGGNVVPPQPGDAAIAPPPAAVPERIT